MSLFTFPKPSKEPATKGRIGLGGRVHYLQEYNDETLLGVGVCHKVSGPAALIDAGVRVTCPDCIGLLMNRRIKKTVMIERRKISL